MFDSEINLYRLFGTIYCRLRRYPVGGAHCAPRQRKIIRFVGEHSDSLRAAYGGCSLDAHCGGCVRLYGITSQMAIYRYKRSVLVDFIIERPLFPSDWACACRDWLLPPMVVLPHACLPVRWWIRFAAAKPQEKVP